MFDGMPEHFYQFLAATSRSPLNTPHHPTVTTTFTLNHAANLTLNYPPNHPSFDASYLLHQLPLHPLQQQQHQQQQQRQQQQQPSRHEVSHNKQQSAPSLILSETHDHTVPWSNEEVLALLKIRSSMDDSWLPAEFTWDNVSRKLAEVGFKRSAEKCKEKFEEETRGFNSNLISNCGSKNISNNYRLYGELEELYHHDNIADCTTNDRNDNTNDGVDHHLQSLASPAPYEQVDDDDPQLVLSRSNQSLDSTNFRGEHEIEEGKKEQERLLDDDNEEHCARKDDKSSNDKMGDDQMSIDDSEKTEENTKKVVRKRKRHEKKFEMFKGFCEKIVNKIMAQQEELHCKILRDMIKRDEEKIARDEAWKKHEIEKITKEMEVRAHEQAIVGDRQTKILDFLNKFTSLNNLDTQSLRVTLQNTMNKLPNTSLSTSSILSQDSITAEQPNSPCTTNHDLNLTSLVTSQNSLISNIPTSSSNENVVPQSPNRLDNSKPKLPKSSSCLDQPSLNPNPLTSQDDSSRLDSSKFDHICTNTADRVMDFRSPDNENGLRSSVKDDTGRRWPRDEVLALINIRCSLFNNNGDHHDRESITKGPLWERISQKMLELGYKRSAKRCKEKWENINKYFRKTKDLNKKRSIDSRTCPYFHQLNHLYNQGAVPGSSERPGDPVASPENQTLPCAQGGSSATNGGTTTVHGCHGNEGTVVQVPGFDFEF